MPTRTDSHLHFFQPGYASILPESCRRVTPDEVTLYQAYRQLYNVEQALVVGFEGKPWAEGNNRHLANLAAEHTWIRPLAFVADPALLTTESLEQRRQEKFVGLSFYRFSEDETAALHQVSDAVWQWLVEHGWLLSVNSRGEHWLAWRAILEKFPDLRLLVSHLGLPPQVAEPPSPDAARQALGSVLSLARFGGVHVKLSGLYALTEPGYGYPHRAAWPYMEALLSAYGTDRLLWGSDFSPSLEWLSFPQTFAVFDHLPSLSEDDVEKITDRNLSALLSQIA